MRKPGVSYNGQRLDRRRLDIDSRLDGLDSAEK